MSKKRPPIKTEAQRIKERDKILQFLCEVFGESYSKYKKKSEENRPKKK